MKNIYKKVLITDINHDTDGEELDLPTGLLAYIKEDSLDDLYKSQELGDFISDITNFLHSEYRIQVLHETEELEDTRDIILIEERYK